MKSQYSKIFEDEQKSFGSNDTPDEEKAHYKKTWGF